MTARFRRVGLLGGTFDPIHYGHLRLAESLSGIFRFDEVLFIPAYSPPHKLRNGITSAYHRHAMTVLATIQAENARVSTIEVFSQRKCYTADTVTAIREEYGPDTHLFFLMGADSFLTLHQWERHRTLLGACHIVAMSRPNYDLGDPATHAARLGIDRIVDVRGGKMSDTTLTENLDSGTHIFLTDLVALDVSATEIRSAVNQGRSIARYVPPLVERYIFTYRLYAG